MSERIDGLTVRPMPVPDRWCVLAYYLECHYVPGWYLARRRESKRRGKWLSGAKKAS